MQTGRLSISRGHQLQEARGTRLRPAPPASPEYQGVHDRLTALERLARLLDLGALSAEEFAAEKALILSLPADELVLRDPAPVHFVPAAPRRAAPGPSLLGRMLSWQFLLLSLSVGIAFSFWTQPAETARLLGF
jgi:hypothetical protein